MPSRLNELPGTDAPAVAGSAAPRVESRLPPAPAPSDPRLLALADQCVMCGLCLPHCPTYRLARNEAESPRGRIALARGIATGSLAPTPSALQHLDQCLACLSCQKVCPSEVRYEEIITLSRAALAPRRRPRGAIAHILRSPRTLVALARLGAVLRVQRWLPKLGRRLARGSLLRTLAESVPDLPVDRQPMARRSRPASRGCVTLFRGCIASVYDRDTHQAATRLLEALGYEVAVARGTPCCGALARHSGEARDADMQAAAARDALTEAGGDVVLVSASGCFGDLRDHVLRNSAAKPQDILAFIAADEAFAALSFNPLSARAALHLACTQVNVVGHVDSIRKVLSRIPALTLLPLPEQPRCCGAAGNYFIEHADIATQLRSEKLEQVAATRPDMLLTTNIGCRIHLGNGLRGAAVPVLHPLALLARQLDNGA